jgi:hypothetical protein
MRRHRRQFGGWMVRLAAFAAMCCLVWGVPASAQASSAPVIESESLSNLGPTDATLEARINTEGLETTYKFYLQEAPLCLDAHPACEVPEYEPLVLPAGTLLGSFVSQSVSVDVNSVGVTLCPSGDRYWVSATNSAGTTIGQRQRMPVVDTLVAVKCTPLRLQLNTVEPAQNAGHGTPAANASNTTPSPKQRVRANAKKLTKALRMCTRKPRKQRASCKKQAEQKFATTNKKKP